MARITKGRLVFNHLGAISTAYRARASTVVRSTAFATEASAKQRAPVDLGALRAGIHVEMEVGALIALIVSSVDYGAAQEYGTSTQPGTPHMIPALESQRAPFLRRMARALKAAA